MITIPWLVLEVTASPSFAGLVVALSSIPSLVMAPFGGLLIQRFGSKWVSVIADAMSTISVLVFPLLALTDNLSGISILTFALLGALFDPLGYTARKTMIQETAIGAGFDLDRLNGIHEGLFGASWVLGPALGAWLIALLGAANSFLLAATFSLLAAAAMVGVRLHASTRIEHESPLNNSKWSDFSLGFRRIWNDRYLRILMFTVLLMAAIYLPTESVLLPTYFESIQRPIEFGLVISALAGGSTVGAFSFGWLVKRISGRSLVRIAFTGAALATLAMALLPPLPLMIVAALLLGMSWGPFTPFLNSQIQNRFRSDEFPMIFSAQTTVFYAAPPMGMLLVGWAVERFGIQTSYLGLALIMLLVVVTALTSRALRESE